MHRTMRLLTIRLETVGHEFLVNYVTLANIVSSGYTDIDWYQCIVQRGHFKVHLYPGACCHTIRKLTHPQNKAGFLINKNRPIPILCTIEHEPKLTKLQ